MEKRRSFEQLTRHTVLTIVWQFLLCVAVLYLIPLFSVSVEVTGLAEQATSALLNIFYWIAVCLALVIIASLNIQRMLRTVRREMGAVYHRSMLLAPGKDTSEELSISELHETNAHIGRMQRKIADMLRDERAQREDLIFKVSAAAHDLRTPLTVIKGNSELLQLARCDERQRQCLADIERASSQIERYVGALISYSQTYYDDRSEWRDHALFEVVGSVRQEVSLVVGDGATLSVESHVTEDGRAHVNLDYLVRAVVNIVLNAKEHADQQDRRIRVSMDQEGDLLVFTVWNSGPPLSDEVLRNYGKLFFRQSKARGSDEGHYGIGLAFARRVAEAHQGDLHLSNVGGGVQVRLRVRI